MALFQTLKQKQTQSLALTPQMQQSIKLLQYSTQELAEFIEQEMLRNPFLVREETAESGEEAGEEQPETGDEEVVAAMEDGAVWEDDREDGRLAYDAEQGEERYAHVRNTSPDFDDIAYDSEQQTSKSLSLREHIWEQIALDMQDPAQRIIATHLIDMLDDSGYIQADFGSLAQNLQCKAGDIEAVLRILQCCDPIGVFSRSLAECLRLQLREKNRLDPVMEKLLSHLDLMASGDIAKLQKVCGEDQETVRDMLAEIKSLDPKPGSRFSAEMVQVMIPDVFVKPDHKGGWEVELNNETLPRVLLNRRYFAEVKQKAKDSEGKKFLSEQWHTANWLTRALHQRAETVLKVASEIVIQQRAFFERGVYHLRPLTLADIASAVDLHESTVGRATTAKFMATPRGIYEMKFFFSSGVSAVEGEEAFSSNAVKQHIKAMIESESRDTVLSDDCIVEQLRVKGIDIARRTVSKYRESMRIPSSVERRRIKKAGLS